MLYASPSTSGAIVSIHRSLIILSKFGLLLVVGGLRMLIGAETQRSQPSAWSLPAFLSSSSARITRYFSISIIVVDPSVYRSSAYREDPRLPTDTFPLSTGANTPKRTILDWIKASLGHRSCLFMFLSPFHFLFFKTDCLLQQLIIWFFYILLGMLFCLERKRIRTRSIRYS